MSNQYVKVSGMVAPIAVTAFRGDAGWLRYTMTSGHWYTGPDQAVAPKRLLTTLHATVGDTITITGTRGRAIPIRIVGEVFDSHHDGLTMLTDWRTLTAADPGPTPDPMNAQYDVGLRPGTDPTTYVRTLGPKLGSNYGVSINQHGGGGGAIAIALAGTLTLLLSITAGLGVLNTVVLHTRERVHDLGVFRAIGMTPRQTLAMVLCSVAGTGLLAGVLAVPAGIAVHRTVIPPMLGAAGLDVPPSLQNVYGGGELAALAPAGLAIALAGALLPAGWAAQSRTDSALPSRIAAAVARVAGRCQSVGVFPTTGARTAWAQRHPRRDNLTLEPIAPSVTPETWSATSSGIPRVPATPPGARNARRGEVSSRPLPCSRHSSEDVTATPARARC